MHNEYNRAMTRLPETPGLTGSDLRYASIIIQRNRAKTKTQCMYLPSFLMGMMNAVTYNQLLCTKDIKTLNKDHFLPKCKQLQVRKQPQDGAKGYKANRVCVVYGRRHTCRPPMLRWASSRETHIVPSHTSSATTQLNSTQLNRELRAQVSDTSKSAS